MACAERKLFVFFSFRYRYKHCYEEAMTSLDETVIRERGINRDDHIHGSLLVLNELFRISDVPWERYYEELMQKLDFNQDANSEVVLEYALLKIIHYVLNIFVSLLGRANFITTADKIAFRIEKS